MAKVSSLQTNGGKAAPNQIVIQFTDNGKNVEQFFSYDTLICEIIRGSGERRVFISETFYDYSKTTARYLNQFLNFDSIKEVRARIKDGTFVTVHSERDTERLVLCETAQNNKAAA